MEIKPEKVFDTTTEEYFYPDLDPWLSRAKEQGAQRGRENLPAEDSDQIEDFEQEFKMKLNARAQKGREAMKNHLADLERELGYVESPDDLETRKHDAIQIRKDAETKLELKAQEAHSELSTRASKIGESRSAMKNFRSKANLTRVAEYTSRRSSTIQIAVFFIIELFLNASLLAGVNPWGLVGSVMFMVLISAVNIYVAALCMGGLARSCNHISTPKKLLAGFGFGIVGILTALFNILVGYFRDDMQAIIGDLSIDVFSLGQNTLARFNENLFSLQLLAFESFQSGMLALVGFLFFAVASWKWLQRDDLYPGYGKLDRNLGKREKEYIKLHQKHCDELYQSSSENIKKLKDIRHKLEINKAKHEEIIKRGNKIVSESPMRQRILQDHLDTVIQAYRTANIDVRTTPQPPVFKEKLVIDEKIFEKSLEFNPSDAASLTEIMEDVHQCILDVQEALDKYLKQLQPLKSIESTPPDLES